MPMTSDDLVSLFDLESVGADRYIGHSPRNGWKRVFGGQVIAQALIAAQRTVEGRAPHSLHVYFILGGDPSEPIVFEVERIRDGRSFATRRVLARQRGEAIFGLSASFQVEEEGLEHQFPMPDAPDPESLADPVQLAALAGEAVQQRVKGFFDHIRPIELRPLDLRRYQPAQPGQKREPRQSIWIRIAGRLPDDPAIHRAALAYLSDMTLLDTVLVAHGYSISERKVPGGEPRPCALAAPPVSRRRMAALRPGQPERVRRARTDPRLAVLARGRAGGERRAGGIASGPPSRRNLIKI